MKTITVIGLSLVTTVTLATASFGEMGGSEEGNYKVLPYPQGGVKQTKKNSFVGHTVKDNQGQTVGTLNSVVVDTAGGNIVAGVVKIPLANNRSALEPVPWKNIHIDPKDGEVHLNMTLKELVPSAVTPYVREIVKGIEEQNQ